MNRWNVSECKLKRQENTGPQVRHLTKNKLAKISYDCLRKMVVCLFYSLLRKALFLTGCFENGLLIAMPHQAFPCAHTGSLVMTVLNVLSDLCNKEPCFLVGKRKVPDIEM